MKEASDEMSSLDRAVRELMAFTERLEIKSRLIVMTTLLHFVSGFLSIALISMGDGRGLRIFSEPETRLTLILTDVLILTLSIIYLSQFERIAKRGELYFSEVANEKNWEGFDYERLRFEYRIALREFSISSELPLARGKSSASIYLFLNILTTAFVLLISIFILKPTAYI